MINCVIVDDEPSAVDILEIFVGKIPFLQLKLATTNPIEALTFIQKNDVDLVFLDINMPDISGLEFAKMLEGKAKIIFTTAYTEFALEGYKYDAIDYLLKPIPFQDFFKACQKAELSIGKIVPKVEEEKTDDYIFVKHDHKGKLTKINFSDILYIESKKNFVSIVTVNNKEKILSLISLKELLNRLPKGEFLRIHKSFIISISKVRLIDGNEIFLNDIAAGIPIGDTYVSELHAILNPTIIGRRNP